MKPINPSEVVARKKEILPVPVLSAFNDLIAERWDGYQSKFTQNEVVNLILNKFPEGSNVRREDVFNKRWLEVAPIYQAEGWVVEVDSPAYNESYETTFSFRKRK